MAKKDLLEEAEKLGVEVDAKAKVADIRALIDEAKASKENPEAENTEAAEDTEETETAKAGKRSAKALKEEAEKQAKAERKASDEAAEKQKTPVKPSRSRLERRSKGFRKSAEQIEKGKVYSLEQAIELAKKTSHVKFDATVEMHVNLAVDPKQADQNIRDTIVLPAGTGKVVKVAVADDALLAKLEKGVIDFDVLVSTPDFMPKLGKYARILGPRGLMPNPKSGTVTKDVDRAVAEAQAGRVEYRVDSTGIVHLGIGKVSFESPQLLENASAVVASIRSNKPSGIKGNYVKSVHLTTSMGPSIPVDIVVVA
ncbi:MAG TPA: 50S ribosomal protein L1 [Candidatus Saccharimonadales bacterium]|jgi:large subunit ribosomal protein L1|nr:50S ribosomal protein L1 [Candidatus Saccharimonadales bacterium]